MKKCIVFARVSTEIQSLDEQSKELQLMASNDGYTKENQYIIEMKESAIKLKEEERWGLNKMKELITNDKEIDCLYIWEISRWARKKYILFSLQNYLLERGIQLKVKNPSITLLNPDKTLNQNADWMFTIYAQLAETEMTLKKERFIKGKNEKKKAGYRTNSKIVFGYTVDENNKFVIHKENAAIVKQIFKMVDTHSTTEIINKMRGLGVHLTRTIMNTMFHNKSYIGQATDIHGNTIAYPRLMDDELFYHVQEVLESRSTRGKERAYNLCQQLIICPNCGHHFACYGTSYSCVYRNIQRAPSPEQRCSCNIFLHKKWADRLALDIARYSLVVDIRESTKDKRKELKRNISECKKRLTVLQKELADIDVRIERIGILFEKGTLTYEKFNARLEDINKDKSRINKEMDYLNKQIDIHEDNLSNALNNQMTKAQIREVMSKIKKNELSKEDAFELTHKYIKAIYVKEVEGMRLTRLMCFETTNNGHHYISIETRGAKIILKTTTELEIINKPFSEITYDDLQEEYEIE